MKTERSVHYGQTAVLNDYKHRDHLLLAGVGYGKTYFGPPWHFKRIVDNPRSPESLVCAPTNKLLKRCLAHYRDYLSDIGLKEGRNADYTINKSDPSITFRIGEIDQIVWFVSGEAPERLVAYTISHAWLDEAALMVEQVKKNVYKRLRCPHASVKRQVLYTTTPEGLNWLYTHFSPDKVTRIEGTPFSRGKNKLVLHGRSHDNPYLDIEYLEGVLWEEFGWDAAYYDNYVNGVFTSLSKNRFYFGFDASRNIGRYPINLATKELIITFDNNVGQMAWAVLQNQDGNWAVVKANRANGRNIDDCCYQIRETLPPEQFGDWVFQVYGDAALHNRSVQTYTTGYDVIEEKLRVDYPNTRIKAHRGNPLVEERSRCTNKLFTKGRLVIDSACTKVIESARVAESNGERGIKKPKDDTVTHAMEAVDMAMICLEPLRVQRGESRGVSF